MPHTFTRTTTELGLGKWWTWKCIYPKQIVPINAGDIEIILETKLDVRDGQAWSQIDKALDRLEGGGGEETMEESCLGDSDEDAADAGVLLCIDFKASVARLSAFQCKAGF